jgi:hypothetical protein
MNGVRGNEFSIYFEKISHVMPLFEGVFAIDKFPSVLPIKKFFVANLSPSNHVGSHWIVICRPEKDCLEIFNSLGYNSLNELMPFLKFRKHYKITYNEQEFQSKESQICGLFCVYFIVYRILNYDLMFDHLLEHIFDADVNTNELKVSSFCENLKISGDENMFCF